MREHRWNYRVITIKPSAFKKQEEKNEDIEHRLNRLGSEGWELVNVVSGVGMYPSYFLKRRF